MSSGCPHSRESHRHGRSGDGASPVGWRAGAQNGGQGGAGELSAGRRAHCGSAGRSALGGRLGRLALGVSVDGLALGVRFRGLALGVSMGRGRCGLRGLGRRRRLLASRQTGLARGRLEQLDLGSSATGKAGENVTLGISIPLGELTGSDDVRVFASIETSDEAGRGNVSTADVERPGDQSTVLVRVEDNLFTDVLGDTGFRDLLRDMLEYSVTGGSKRMNKTYRHVAAEELQAVRLGQRRELVWHLGAVGLLAKMTIAKSLEAISRVTVCVSVLA